MHVVPKRDTAQSPPAQLSEASNNWTIWVKAIGATLGFLSLFIAVTILTLTFFIYKTGTNVLDSAGLTWLEARAIISSGWEATPKQTEAKTTFLVLGLDSLETRPGSPPLTDAIFLASVSYQSGAINLLSFPRDLWLEPYQSRINALYVYGKEQHPEDPTALVRTALTEITGVPINYTIVLTFDQVATIIDTFGGLPINVTHPFTDEKFPRPDVDVTKEHDPTKLYETVTFEAGAQTFTGSQALAYIRSRKSEGDEGTDIARGLRQQELVAALVDHVKKPQTWKNPELLGQLYRVYQQNWGTSVPIVEIVAMAKQFWPVRNQIQVSKHQIPILPDESHGIILHPDPKKYQNQWIYIIPDQAKFTQFTQTVLGFKSKTATEAGQPDTMK